MFAVIVTTFARRFKGDWRRAGRCEAKKRNCDNRERFARHCVRVISFCHCCVERKKGRDIVAADRVCVHVAQSVLDEVSRLKDMGDTRKVRKRAAKVSKRLLECLESANPFQLREGEVLFLEAETPRLEEYPKLNPASG